MNYLHMIKNSIYLVTALIFGLNICLHSQTKNDNLLAVMWYNTENLFDTINDPGDGDDDFTPSGKLGWNTERYLVKLDRISEVIKLASKTDYPAIVGLCEIENKKVLEDLVKNANIIKAGYSVIHQDSPDERGIDVAMLYRDNIINCISYRYIKVALDSADKTRDILYFKGKFRNGEILHFFANHWPSRRGGEAASEWKRMKAANTLRLAVDSVLKTDSKAAILIMGDFNDEPSNKSIKQILKAGNSVNSGDSLFNLAAAEFLSGNGTHYYMNEWNMLDQAIISPLFFNPKSKIRVDRAKPVIFKPEQIIYTDKKTNNQSPSRTYVGNKYTGGYSDHFPLVVTLICE